MMRLTHLHLFGGDDPDGALKIELLPFRMAKLARTDKDVRCNLQRLFGEARSEEHTSELQSLMRISYAVFCLKKKKKSYNKTTNKITRITYDIESTHQVNT